MSGVGGALRKSRELRNNSKASHNSGSSQDSAGMIGSVSGSLLDGDNDEVHQFKKVSEAHDGQMFGELALVSNKPRAATI